MNMEIKMAVLLTLLITTVKLQSFLQFADHNGSFTDILCSSPAWCLCRTEDICTNTCYLSNMYRLHKSELNNKARLPFLVMLLLLLSGDISLNPGPLSDGLFPCGVCQLAVSWSHKAVACDNCDVWVHKSCASMDSVMYEQVENLTWKCYCCRSVNVSSFVINAYNLPTANSFAPLACIPGDDSVHLPDIPLTAEQFVPGSHSSPAKKCTANYSPSLSHSSHSSTSVLSTTKGNNIRFVVINANGVSGKRAELAELCSSTQADIMIVTETKLDSSKRASEFFPKNYEVSVRRDRDGNGGGVLIAAKNGLVVDEVQLKASGEIVCARIAVAKASPLYVCAYYRPPNDNDASLDSLQDALVELTDLIKDKSTLVLAGDFNSRDIDWDLLIPTVNCKKKSLCNKLINILGDAELDQMQREHTRNDAILDLFCTNKPSLVKVIDTIPGISDHDGIILVDMYLKAQISKKPQRRVPVWSKANWEEIKKDTTTFCTEFVNSSGSRSVEDSWDLFVTHLKSIQDKYIPNKLTSTRHNVPWLTTDAKRLCRKKRRLYRKAKASQDPVHKEAFKKAQNSTRKTLKKAHWLSLIHI